MKNLGRLSKLMTILYASITGLTQEIAYKKTVRAPLLFIFVIHTSQEDSGGSKINSYSLISAIF
ncbi:hypothetical protein K737_300033 [Holospora undulata HU1]|uniref:Uncharacterized protein n=2 Tax=Holospora TaxID=44747 RepID=A0A061JIL6_9PROT|nr:hypothetical protein K737_300033 [Holospora undulata HU1]